MAETIDEFLVDFYKKKNNEEISLDKIQTIKQTYGNDYDNLIIDLYEKYDSKGLEEDKLPGVPKKAEVLDMGIGKNMVERFKLKYNL